MDVMPMDVNRWLKYAKAKLDDTLASGNEQLDKLEARQEADRADKPWLGAEGDAPSFDEARARIAWETERAERESRADVTNDAPGMPPARASSDRIAPTRNTAAGVLGDPAPGSSSRVEAPTSPTDPQTTAEAAERSAAQIVIDQRAEESKARLAAIRAELGVDDPEPPG